MIGLRLWCLWVVVYLGGVIGVGLWWCWRVGVLGFVVIFVLMFDVWWAVLVCCCFGIFKVCGFCLLLGGWWVVCGGLLCGVFLVFGSCGFCLWCLVGLCVCFACSCLASVGGVGGGFVGFWLVFVLVFLGFMVCFIFSGCVVMFVDVWMALKVVVIKGESFVGLGFCDLCFFVGLWFFVVDVIWLLY